MDQSIFPCMTDYFDVWMSRVQFKRNIIFNRVGCPLDDKVLNYSSENESYLESG